MSTGRPTLAQAQVLLENAVSNLEIIRRQTHTAERRVTHALRIVRELREEPPPPERPDPLPDPGISDDYGYGPSPRPRSRWSLGGLLPW